MRNPFSTKKVIVFREVPRNNSDRQLQPLDVRSYNVQARDAQTRESLQEWKNDIHRNMWQRVCEDFPSLQIREAPPELDRLASLFMQEGSMALGKLFGEIHSLRMRNGDLEHHIRDMNEKPSEKIRKLKRAHKIECQQLEARNQAKLNDQIRKTQRALVEKDHEMHAFRNRLEGEKNDLNYRLSIADSVKRNEINQILNKHASEIGKYQSRIETMISEHREERERTDFEHASKISDMEDQHTAYAERTLQDHTEHINRMTLEHMNSEDTLKENQRIEVELMQDELSAINTALLERDKEDPVLPLIGTAEFKKDPDEHIKTQFLNIVELVDGIAKATWKKDQKVWTEEILKSRGPDQNIRLLKKRIVSDIIWNILHKYVFCSPFRVFGHEGEILEQQWNEHCGEDPSQNNGLYTWPKPEIETERWRCFTIKECCKALKRSFSEFDPRSRIRNGYRTNMNALISELKMTLKDMLELEHGEGQIVDLVKKLAAVWLDFMMHRCRILIPLKGATKMSNEEKARQAQDGFLTLTVAPSLMRHGNIKGLRMDRSMIVGGCKGETFSMS